MKNRGANSDISVERMVGGATLAPTVDQGLSRRTEKYGLTSCNGPNALRAQNGHRKGTKLRVLRGLHVLKWRVRPCKC